MSFLITSQENLRDDAFLTQKNNSIMGSSVTPKPQHAYPSYFRHAPLDHAVAGIAAGGVACLLMHPFDLVKIRLQVEPASVYKNSVHAIRTILKQEGIGVFRSGLTASLTGNASAWGLYFMGYNLVKDQMRALTGTPVLSSTESAVAGMTTGFGVLCLTNPIWVAKTRLCTQQLQRGFASSSSVPGGKQPTIYRGLAHCLKTVASEEGVRGLYSGFAVGSIGVIHGALQFSFYDVVKTAVLRYKAQHGGHELHQLESEKPHKFSIQGDASNFSTAEYLSIAVASKTFASTVTYPLQLVRANLQVLGAGRPLEGILPGEPTPKTALDVMRHIYISRGGLLGFFRGLPVHVFRLMPHTIVLFATYEAVRSALSDAAPSPRSVAY